VIAIAISMIGIVVSAQERQGQRPGPLGTQLSTLVAASNARDALKLAKDRWLCPAPDRDLPSIDRTCLRLPRK
jgi:hypothetical protein